MTGRSTSCRIVPTPTAKRPQMWAHALVRSLLIWQVASLQRRKARARMNFEKSPLKQHGLIISLMLWATACSGTAFTGTGSAGAGGAGTGGTGAGGTGSGVAGMGGGVVCYAAACPLIACDGISVTKPGECCP